MLTQKYTALNMRLKVMLSNKSSSLCVYRSHSHSHCLLWRMKAKLCQKLRSTNQLVSKMTHATKITNSNRKIKRIMKTIFSKMKERSPTKSTFGT